ncbi:MAG: HEAT repeat domain-containing protein [Gemmatimonadetes bacterium]|nr:HEAT repeat domain-containing protein [Gemmatimonadota bacterium]
MAHSLVSLAVSSLIVAGGAQAVEAQQLAQRVAAARDGKVRMTFATRPEVCGDGRFIGLDTPRGFRMYSFWANGSSVETLEDVQPDCRHGPMRLVVVKAAGRIVELRAAVGVSWRLSESAADLGTVAARDVAAWLLDLVPDVGESRFLSLAVLAAVAADSTRIADRLMSLARDRGRGLGVRAQSLRWLTDAAEREGKASAAQDALRSIVQEATELTALRERAVRELASPANDAFLRETYRGLGEISLKERVLRRLGEARTPDNVAWIRGVALDPNQARRLRDRALRVLGEEMGRREEMRDLFNRLDDVELKVRALRVMVEGGDEHGKVWLRTLVMDAAQPVAIRDRAARLLADGGATSADLAALYDGVTGTPVRQRIVRLLAERGDDVAIEKLMAIAQRDPEPETRRFTLKRLGETRSPKARVFLEGRLQ